MRKYSLETAFARWRKQRARVRDAATKPTRENIEAFYRNALRSSGSAAEAKARTRQFFDLADLAVDADGHVIRFKVADERMFPRELTAGEINERNRKFWEGPQRQPPGADEEHDERPALVAPNSGYSRGVADHLGALAALNRANSRHYAQPTKDAVAHAGDAALLSPTSSAPPQARLAAYARKIRQHYRQGV